MKLASVSSFYRAASSSAPAEDRSEINVSAGLFVVCDGVSGPYSQSNPGVKYRGLTGGQMASASVSAFFATAGSMENIEDILLNANRDISYQHLLMKKDPKTEAVGGACVAACQLLDKEIVFVVAGDSFVFYKNRCSDAVEVVSNFDQAAFEFEQKGDRYFQECKEKCGGNISSAWELYFSYFAEKQFYRANKNVGSGGHAMINGDSSWLDCCTIKKVDDVSMLEWILLCTDGLLPQEATNPMQRDSFARHVGLLYEEGGLEAILRWRDREGNQSHITGWPEATAIEIKFAK